MILRDATSPWPWDPSRTKLTLEWQWIGCPEVRWMELDAQGIHSIPLPVENMVFRDIVEVSMAKPQWDERYALNMD